MSKLSPRKIKLRLVLDVDYSPNGTKQETLEWMLNRIAERAASDGMMTGETPATVDCWKAKVEKITVSKSKKSDLTLTHLPLSLAQVERLKDKNDYISVVMALAHGFLGVSADSRNDACSAAILGDESGLEEISYRPIGVQGNDLIVKVTGNVFNWLGRQEIDN